MDYLKMYELDTKLEDTVSEIFDVEIDEKLRAYIGENQTYYRNKFFQIENRKKQGKFAPGISANLSAFLFSYLWMMYRKMYVEGIVWCLISTVGLSILRGFMFLFLMIWGYAGLIPIVLLALATLFVPGLFGNAYYKKRLEKLIAAESSMTELQIKGQRDQKGDVSVPAVIITIVAAFILRVVLRNLGL